LWATRVTSPTGKLLTAKSIRDKPYSTLKSGQTSTERNFYAEATHEQPDGKAVLSNYGRFQSVYGQNVSGTVALGDYKVPLKNNNTMCKSFATQLL
jgi:hypothetical protein